MQRAEFESLNTIQMSLQSAEQHLHHNVGSTQLQLSCALINIARGKVLDEDALITALQDEAQGPAGAVLDVFASEPLPASSTLWDLPNVVLTAHDSWRTDEALRDNHRYFLDNVGRLGRGETLQGLVSDELMAPALA